MKIFLEIPLIKVKSLYNKSERFVNQLQLKDEDDLVTDSSEMQDEEEYLLNSSISKKKKKKCKIHTKSSKEFFFEILIFTFILLGYVIIDFFIADIFTKNFSKYVQEIDYLSFTDSKYFLLNNAFKLMIIKSNFPTLSKNSFEIAKLYVNDLYDLNSQIQKVIYELIFSSKKNYSKNKISHNTKLYN